jgi:hypothetical protein
VSSGLFGDWDKLANLLDPRRLQKRMSQTTRRAGANAAAAVVKGIKSGAPGGKTFEPLQQSTIDRKGSSKPLIDEGDLMGSITYVEIGPGLVWVGVKKGSRSSSGGDLVDIAWVHEFGKTIEITPTRRIHIPERSFLRATLNDPTFREAIGELYLEALERLFLP